MGTKGENAKDGQNAMRRGEGTGQGLKGVSGLPRGF